MSRKAELYASLMPREPRWYVAAIICGFEATAVEHLGRQGFEAFMPMSVDRGVDAKGKLVEQRRPRFRGYGFVALDLDVDAWRSVNGTRGVRHLLPLHHERPLALPIGFIEKLQAEPERAEQTIAQFLDNDLVRVIAGQFADRCGRVERQAKDGDVRMVFENGFRTTLKPWQIEKA